jgi:serine/threonine protein kinase
MIGSSMICEKANVTVLPENVLTSWKDDQGHIFYLRPNEGTLPQQTTDTAYGPIHNSGTSGAVWEVGGLFCKVKAWAENIEMEADTLAYVRERFNIPVPEVVYHWVESASSRSFLIQKPVGGKTLQRVWSSLSDRKRRGVAAQVAQYCSILAKETSDSLKSAIGCGIRDRYLLPENPQDAPSWKPIPFPPLPKQEAALYLYPLDAGEIFHFSHADLSPTNIMVSDDGSVTGILDWESAAFYPRVWIGTKPKVSYGFILEDVDGDNWAWSKLLVEALEERQFSTDVTGFSDFRKKEKLVC